MHITNANNVQQCDTNVSSPLMILLAVKGAHDVTADQMRTLTTKHMGIIT